MFKNKKVSYAFACVLFLGSLKLAADAGDCSRKLSDGSNCGVVANLCNSGGGCSKTTYDPCQGSCVSFPDPYRKCHDYGYTQITITYTPGTCQPGGGCTYGKSTTSSTMGMGASEGTCSYVGGGISVR